MLFTINFDQTRKMKQEEAAKDNALAEASAMTKTQAANLAGIWHGQKKGKFHLRCAKESFGYVWCFLCLLMSTWLTWTPYFLEIYFCICFFGVFFVFVVVGCLGHDFLDGLRPLGRHSLDVLFQ